MANPNAMSLIERTARAIRRAELIGGAYATSVGAFSPEERAKVLQEKIEEDWPSWKNAAEAAIAEKEFGGFNG